MVRASLQELAPQTLFPQRHILRYCNGRYYAAAFSLKRGGQEAIISFSGTYTEGKTLNHCAVRSTQRKRDQRVITTASVKVFSETLAYQNRAE